MEEGTNWFELAAGTLFFGLILYASGRALLSDCFPNRFPPGSLNRDLYYDEDNEMPVGKTGRFLFAYPVFIGGGLIGLWMVWTR